MTSQYGAHALHAGLARLYARTLKHTRPDTYTHARTYRPISNTHCFSTATMIHERAAVLRYAYIACLVSAYYRYFCAYVSKVLSSLLFPEDMKYVSSNPGMDNLFGIPVINGSFHIHSGEIPCRDHKLVCVFCNSAIL